MITLPPPRPRRGAFTLIELLVVISIIALLIGILLPALGSARHAARVTSDLTHFQQINIANANYGADYDSYYPVVYRLNNNNNVSIEEQMVPYIVTGFSYGFDDAAATQYMFRNQTPDIGIFTSPLDTLPLRWGDFENQKRSYALNRAEAPADGNWAKQHNNGVSRDIQTTDATCRTPDAGTDGFSRRVEDVLSSSDSITWAPNFNDTAFSGWSNGSVTNSFETMGANRSAIAGNNPWALNPNRWYGYAGSASEPGQDPKDVTPNFGFADGHSSAVKGADTINPDFPGSIRGDGQSLWNCEKR